MHPDIKTLVYEAEDHYLKLAELKIFKDSITSLVVRLETYKLLRDREIDIFQPVADALVDRFSEESQETLERALKHWLSVVRYCAMAMLLNNPEFLQRRILEWLTDIVQAHQIQEMEKHLYQLLKAGLQENLTERQWALLEPFLSQAEMTLFKSGELVQL